MTQSLSFYKPETLFIISDGPRENSKNDKENILQSRKIFEKINWKCEVLFNNSDSNLGCRERIITGLNWVFSKVDQVIILEDDCIPSIEFFIFMVLKYILDGVLDNIKTLTGFVTMLENRVRVMNNEIIKIDLLISQALELKPDVDRVARAENFVEDGSIDSRRD